MSEHRSNAAGQPIEETGVAGWGTPALIVGIVFLVISALGLGNPADFYRGWLTGYLFWFCISAGSLGLLMLHYMTGGQWGIVLRRPLGAGARTFLWLMPLAFVPVVLGMKYLFSWMDADFVAHDQVMQLKTWYLNSGFFIGRAIFFFVWFAIWAWALKATSRRFEATQDPAVSLLRARFAGSGLVFICLILTFVSVDWMMSTEPKWMSTMYGINFVVQCGLSAFAFLVFIMSRLVKSKVMSEVLSPMHFRDWGNLTLAFVMLYAYTAFSEFLLIWYANLKEEIPHYLVREHGMWGFFAILLVLFHFFLPFFMLLMRPIKDRPATAAVVALIVLVMRFICLYWLVGPSWYGEEFHFPWVAITSTIGIGGIWIWSFVQSLKGQTIVPVYETWVEEAIREGAERVHA